MNRLAFHELKDVLEAEVLCEAQKDFAGVATDTRKGVKDCLFVAIKGEHFDGHNFLEQAMKERAGGLLVETWPLSQPPSNISVLKVTSTLKALQSLAQHKRVKGSFKVVAITGSQGKTTTKDFAYKLIYEKILTHKSQRSFNNQLGVPLTLLEAEEKHKVVLVEMGMNKPGEIAELCQIAQPDVALITCLGSAHKGFFSSMEELVQAKEEIYRTPSLKLPIFNRDQVWTERMYEELQDSYSNCLTFSSQKKECSVFLQAQQTDLKKITLKGTVQSVYGEVQVPIFGEYNVYNFMGAACIALACGISPHHIWERFPSCRSSWGRNQWLSLENGTQILFDAYNSSPESAQALLESVVKISVRGQRYLILGEMLELGEEASFFHEALGQLVAQGTWAGVWFMGASCKAFERGFLGSSKNQKRPYISDSYNHELASQLVSMLKPEDLLVLKGSRRMGLERILAALGAVNF